MKPSIFLLCIFFPIGQFAQQSEVRGVVSVHNSEYETGKRQFVSNAQVEDDFGKANATTTGVDGRFKLVFVGIRDNEKVTFNVTKEGMEIVNTEALSAVAGQKERVALFMSPEGKIAENRLIYYNINREATEKALTTKLQKIGDEILALKQDEAANIGRIEKLQTEYNFLQKQFKKIDQSARELAERYAKINLDDQTKEYQEAFRYFQKGQLEEALKILDQFDLEKAGKAIVQAQERNRMLDKEWIERDSIKNEKKRQVTEGLSFKAELHKAQFEFAKVEETYQLLLRLDSSNVYTLWNFAYFLSEQNKIHEATYYYEKALSLAKAPEMKATLLNNLAIAYQKNQKMQQADGAYNQALRIRRELALKNPDAFLPNVATTLSNLGNYYRDNLKMSQAEDAFNEALKIIRQLVEKNPDAFLSDLAAALNNIAIYYRINQKMPQAEGAFNEALKIRRRLAEEKPDAFLSDVAATLHNLGVYYYDNRKMPQAEDAYNEALKIYRELAMKNPNAFLPDVAMTLNCLGNHYSYNQKIPQAESAFNDALKTYRCLAEKNPDAFLPFVAATLHNLGTYYYNQKMPQAEDAYNEALIIYKQLALKNPDAFLPNVATTSNNLGALHDANRKMPQAEEAFNEALKIRRQLAEKNPDAFLLYVAETLNNLGAHYCVNQKMPQAEAAFNEALKIRRQLAEKNPDAFLPDFAMTLLNLGSYYSYNQKIPQAEDAYNEALIIYKQLAEKNFDAFLPYVAGTLKNLGSHYGDNQKIPQAEDAFNEALKIYRQLAEKNPDAFLPFVAEILINLGLLCKTLQNHQQALNCYDEALGYYEQAILDGGVHFFDKWEDALRNISEVKDSAVAKKEYVNIVQAGQLLAESSDKLKGINKKLLPIAVSEYGSLSWWALLAKDYTLAEKAALRCLELDPTQEWVLTNLGHSQILRGQYKTGMATYRNLKGKKNDKGKDFKAIIIQDINDLEAVGISHPDFAKAKRAIEKW